MESHALAVDMPKKHRTKFLGLKIALGIILVIGFIASILVSIFIGGELLEKPVVDNSTKGLIRLEEPNYQKEYFVGDTFSFDKDENQVTLVARNPALENPVKIDDLPGPEYGFIVRKVYDEENNLIDATTLDKDAILKPLSEKPIETEEATEEAKQASRFIKGANDEVASEDEETTEEEEEQPIYYYEDSQFYEEAKSIKMTIDMGNIYLTSRRYRDLRLALDTTVINGHIDTKKLVNDITLEAEKADIYKDDVLLTDEQLATMPDDNKPFDSSKGKTVAGQDCSGGACLRSFGSNNMKIDFVVVSDANVEVDLLIKICLRPNEGNFSSFFKFNLNGITYDAVDDQEIPAGPSGQYYEPYDLTPVTVSLQRGTNHFIFESGASAGTSTPVNFDAINLTTKDTKAHLGGSDVIVLNQEDTSNE